MNLDFHIHTKYSEDSNMDPADIIRIAKKRGLDGIAITDHNTIQGAFEARELNEDPEFYIIIGSQITTDSGDITGLFLQDAISSTDIHEVIQEIKNQDGLVVFPFPFRNKLKADEIMPKVDLIEVFNARSDRYQNIFAEEYAKKYQKAVIGGSDAHLISEIGLVKNQVLSSHSFDEIKGNILSSKNSIIRSQLTYNYCKRYSQYLRAVKQKQYSASIPLLIKAAGTYVFRVDPEFVVDGVVPADDMQKDLDYFQRYYTAWMWRYQHRQRINNFLDLIKSYEFRPDERILEIGCGRGIYSTIIGQKNKNVISLEISERELSVAQDFLKKKKLNSNVDLIRADAQYLPLKDNIFDFVLCLDVLEHLQSPPLGVNEIYRTMKPGKRGIVVMPNLFSYYYLKNRIIEEVKNVFKKQKCAIDSHMKYPFWNIRAMCETPGLNVKPLRSTHIFSGGLFFGFLLNNFPGVIRTLNNIEKNFNISYISSFFFMEVAKMEPKKEL